MSNKESTTLSPTPTLAPNYPEKASVITDDEEKQAPDPPLVPGTPFPEGGQRAWAAVLGAWLAGTHRYQTASYPADQAQHSLLWDI